MLYEWIFDKWNDFPTNTRYYDTYGYATDDEHYNRRILGDATGEMGPFAAQTYGSQARQVSSCYDDEGWFVYPGWPWFLRGAVFYDGSDTGVFAFESAGGHVNNAVSFRVVVSI